MTSLRYIVEKESEEFSFGCPLFEAKTSDKWEVYGFGCTEAEAVEDMLANHARVSAYEESALALLASKRRQYNLFGVKHERFTGIQVVGKKHDLLAMIESGAIKSACDTYRYRTIVSDDGSSLLSIEKLDDNILAYCHARASLDSVVLCLASRVEHYVCHVYGLIGSKHSSALLSIAENMDDYFVVQLAEKMLANEDS